MGAQFSVKDGEALVEKFATAVKTLNKNRRDHLRRSGFLFRPATAGEKAFLICQSCRHATGGGPYQGHKDAKLAFWGPQMKDGAPSQLYVPQVVLASTTFMIDGERVKY